MSSKKVKTKDFFSKMRKKLSRIFFDVVYLYKHFLHWNISKILIFIWSMVLGFTSMIPFLLIAIVIGYVDPINWSEIMNVALSGGNASIDSTTALMLHPFWLASMAFVLLVAAIMFLLSSSYSLLLQANLSLHYLNGKPLKYKKNLYFSRKHFSTFMALISWNIVYLLAPIMIWAGVVFFMYLFHNIGYISMNGISILIAIATLILIVALIYLVYRIAFGYILLARDEKKKKLLPGRAYLRKSIEITKGGSFWIFLFVSIVYSLVFMPLNMYDAHLEIESGYLRDTILYNNGMIEKIEPEQLAYYEYITAEYTDLSNEEIVKKINAYYTMRIILFFLIYFLSAGLFVYILASFYERVLQKK